MVISPSSFVLVNNMVDGKKKRAEATESTLNDVINSLVSTLRDSDYSMEFDGLTLRYHIDIGILVKLVTNEIPDFPIGTNWLQEGTGYDWLVNSIEVDGDKFVVGFLLEEEI